MGMSTNAAPIDLRPRATVRRTAPDDLAPAATALARAVEDDPVFRWCIPDPARRRARSTACMRAVAELAAPHDEVYVAAVTRRPATSVVDGAALGVPAGAPSIAAAVSDVVRAALGDDGERACQLLGLLGEHRPREPHRELWCVGVAPTAGGTGVGSALLAAVLAAADRAGEPVHLAATSEGSRRRYERHGFDVVAELATGGSPTLWAMRRAPRAA
jgi:GNAT superfamily N-acetyltransferase